MAKQITLLSISLMIGLIVVLAFSETALRLLGYSSRIIYQPNPYFGWTLPPSETFDWSTDGDKVSVQTNSHGLRGREVNYEKPSDTFRVLVIGDSFTEALQVPLASTYVSLLESSLRAEGATHAKAVEVVNAGLSGFGTDNALLFFASEGIKYRPDFVVLGFYVGNDVRNNLRELEILDSGGDRKPHYDLVDGDLLLREYPFLGQNPTVARLKVWLNRHVLTYVVVQDVRERLRDRGAPAATGERAVPLDLNVFRVAPVGPWRKAWEITEKLLEELDREVRAAGAQLIVVLIPTRFQVHREHWMKMRNELSLADGDWDVEQPNRRLFDRLRHLGVHVVDLLPLFLAEVATEPEREVYLANDGHWNDSGHRVAARAVTSELRRLVATNARRKSELQSSNGPGG